MMSNIKAFIHGNRAKLVKTLAMYISFIGLGLGLGVTGPSMLDLQISTKSSLEEITWMIIGRALGIGFGCILNIYLHRVVNIHFLITMSMTLGGLSEGFVPFSWNVYILVGTFFFQGACMGIVETCSNSLITNIWGDRCPSFLQALYFCFGLGCILAPLLVRPFLLPLTDEQVLTGNYEAIDPSAVQVKWPYLTIAAFMCASAAFWWYVYFFVKEERQVALQPKESSKRNSEDSAIDIPPEDANWKTNLRGVSRNSVVLYIGYVIAMMFMFFYCGVEIGVGTYLTPFAVNSDMHLSKATGALLSSTYWMTFTFARLATIFYIDWMGARNNLIMALTFVGISNIFTTPFGNSIEWCLWAGVALNGIGMSSIWATLVAFISQFTPMTESLTSLMVASACLGECVIPIVISALLDIDVRIFLWTILFCSVVMIVLFCLLYLDLYFYKKMLQRDAEISSKSKVNGHAVNIELDSK